ncbi:glycosyltransferase [Limibacillus sp. MBR-115]|jgi:glycosyltransferase involved in cell wall biosynthesis|uniref:glycosyltransferase family 4 protein n=1 Tax=Limibacillus sp. MBR-115 TaxID=3156465 RepID=UPI0033957600
MKVAFYAPMKPPDHPVPSGDRHMARLLISALERSGHDVTLASRLVSRDGRGDALRQARLQRLGSELAERLLRRYARAPRDQLPELWLTYHLYYKAPDHLGPKVSKALGIPYMVAEASVAPKRAGGPWDLGHRAVLSALGAAKGAITLNPADAGCLDPALPQLLLPPFLDPQPYEAARGMRSAHRKTVAERFGMNPEKTWLLTVAMMRPGDKLASYRLLAEALKTLATTDWEILVVGDGAASGEVREAFQGFANDQMPLRWARALPGEMLPTIYAAADLFVWPAIREAYGMALLEAQAAGLAVVAGREGGVPAVVDDQSSGLLTPPGDCRAFAAAVSRLIADPDLRGEMGRKAAERVSRTQNLDVSARKITTFLERCRTP